MTLSRLARSAAARIERESSPFHDGDTPASQKRIAADQRATDETPEEFEERITEIVAEEPDDIFKRAVIVRLDDELPAVRRDLLDRNGLGGHPHAVQRGSTSSLASLGRPQFSQQLPPVAAPQ